MDPHRRRHLYKDGFCLREHFPGVDVGHGRVHHDAAFRFLTHRTDDFHGHPDRHRRSVVDLSPFRHRGSIGVFCGHEGSHLVDESADETTMNDSGAAFRLRVRSMFDYRVLSIPPWREMKPKVVGGATSKAARVMVEDAVDQTVKLIHSWLTPGCCECRAADSPWLADWLVYSNSPGPSPFTSRRHSTRRRGFPLDGRSVLPLATTDT